MSDRRRKGSESEVEISMTPMIDVTFQLLVFFIVTLQFRKLERELDSFLPTDRGNRPLSARTPEELEVDVSLRRRGGEVVVLWSGARVEAADVAEACSIVERRLTAFKSRFPEAAARLDVGEGVLHADAVRVLDLLHRADFGTIRLAGVAAVRSAADIRALGEALPGAR